MKAIHLRTSRLLLLVAGILLLGAAGLAVRAHGRHALAQTGTSFTNCDVDSSKLALDAEEQKLLDATNQYRATSGLPLLKPDYLLTRIALWKANELMTYVVGGGNPSARGHDGHDDNFRSWDQRFRDCGYTSFFGLDMTGGSMLRGENLGGGGGYDTADGTLSAFQHSPPHNANLLCPGYVAVGIKRVKSSDPKLQFWVWAMDFGGAVDQDLAAAVKLVQSGQDPLATITPPDNTTTVYPDQCDLPPEG